MTLKLNTNSAVTSEINPTKLGFVSWFFNYLNTRGNSSFKNSQTHADYSDLEESIIEDNWIYIESDKERLEQLKYNIQKDIRQKELEDLAKKKKFSAKLHENWRAQIQKLLDSLSPEETHRSKATLDSNTRYFIIGNIVKQFQDKWLDEIGQVYWQSRSNSTDDVNSVKAWNKFIDTFYEKPYEKNIVGNLRDFGFFCYHSAGVTGLTLKVLEDVVACWYHLLNLSATALLARELTEDESRVLELGVSDAILPLIKLHIETAKKVANSLSREGKLPKKWKEEKLKEQQRIVEIKSKGVDARYEGDLPRIRQNDRLSKEALLSIKEFLTEHLTMRVPDPDRKSVV